MAGPFSEERRFELKLAFHPLREPQVRAAIVTHPAGFRRAYPPRRVNNVYLDTLELSNLNDNRDGLDERRKVRLRWYGGSDRGVPGAIEVKHRRGGNNGKLREELPAPIDLGDGRRWSQIIDDVRRNVSVETLAAVDGAWQPMLVSRYSREYYVTPDGEIRLTLDFDQETISQLACARPNTRFPLPPPMLSVVEVKGPLTAEDRIMQITSVMPIRVSRNSKYAIALERALRV